jgi:hypothetical protein
MSAPHEKELRSRDAALRVNQFRSSRMVFQRNYEELLTFLDYVCAPSVAFSYSRVDQKWLWHDGMNEIERLLHNFVAAALSLVDHTRVLYHQLYKPDGHLAEYQDKVSADFAEDPLTQFVIKLRQMAQHYRLPSLENHTKMTDIKNGLVGSVRIQLRLKVDDLRKFDGWNVPAKKFLDSAGLHIDLRSLIVAYHAHVRAFYEWFDQRQKEMHGIGPDLVGHLSMHGVSVGPRKEVVELAEGITNLESKQREDITFADLEMSFSPVLSILDTRRLMLCTHDGRVWIQAALEAAQSRFTVPAELETRIRALL